MMGSQDCDGSDSTYLGTSHEENLLVAMNTPMSDLVSWSLDAENDTTEALLSLGIISPQSGTNMAYLYTGEIGVSPEPGTDLLGDWAATGDRVDLNLELLVPIGSSSLHLKFYFLSSEYPEWVNQTYNDTFEVVVTGSAWSGNAAVDSFGNLIGVDSALFSVTQSSDLQGTGYENGIGGGTGWVSVDIPVTEGELLGLTFSIYDVTDGVYDSGVLIDQLEWGTGSLTEPTVDSE
jgi:hypothetical protein